MKHVTGAELKEIAEKIVSDKMIDVACKEKYFREFIRIFITMNIGVAHSKLPATFGHSLTLYDADKKPVTIEIDISIKSV